MARRGKRPALDETKKLEIVALLTVGCSQRVAARYVGCAARTITRTAARDPVFAEKLRKAACNTEIGYLKNIQKAARKEQYWRAAAWALERMKPETYGPRAPGVVTAQQIQLLMTQFAAVIVTELPNPADRQNVLKQLNRLTRSFGVSTPPPTASEEKHEPPCKSAD